MKPNNRKPKKLANEIVDSGLDYALYQQPDPKKRIKAYRIAASEFNLLADQMEGELDFPAQYVTSENHVRD